LIYGVDYAWSHPSPAALKAAANPDGTTGKKFVVRYGGSGIDDSKMLTAGELSRLIAADIAAVSNVEGTAGGFRGYSAGQSFARRGRSWFKNLGMPDNRPIYYSADWDVQPGDWPDLKAALDGAASVDGRGNVGLYGGLYAIQQAQRTGAAKWYWQTYGWSTRKQPDGSYKVVWADGTHIQQYRNGVKIDGADCDLNRALTADYGQWGVQEENVDEQSIITALYNDLHRNPGTPNPPGQSGLNQLFRQFVHEETATVLAPIATAVSALRSDVAAVKAQVASGISVDPNAVATAIETAVQKAVAAIAAQIKPGS